MAKMRFIPHPNGDFTFQKILQIINRRFQVWPILFLVIFSLLLNSTKIKAQQLEVNNSPPFTPENLITNVFLDEGMEVLEVVYNGPPASVAFFKNGDADIGLSRGLVMTTGIAVTNNSQNGVNAPGNQRASENNGSNIIDIDLETLAGSSSIRNIVRYTITFIPISESLRFRYCFASEEYPEYVCSPYNDVFGFFISGPGIDGPFQNGAENIALIPGTTRPVTINNVNPGVIGTQNAAIALCEGDLGSLAYSQYYNSNTDSTNFPVFDGFTDVFVAEAQVIPGEVYTIKLVIADNYDHRLDSGVFLEAKSLESPAIKADATSLTIDGAIAEGCDSSILTFTLPKASNEDFTFEYVLKGTANNGIDYYSIPSELIIPAGETQLTVPVHAIDDGIVEGRESIIFDWAVSPSNRKSYTIFIDDPKSLPPANLETEISICDEDESVQFHGNSPVSVPTPVSFSSTQEINTPGSPLWSGLSKSTIEVSDVYPDKLGPGVIKSISIDSFEHQRIEDMDFYLIGPDGQYLELTTDNGEDGGNGDGFDYYINTCFTATATQPINFPGPSAPSSGVPFSGNFLPEGEWSDFWGPDKNTNGTYTLLFNDDSSGNSGTLFGWSITFESTYGITYEWSPTAGLSCSTCPDPIIQPNENTNYTFTIRDSYGCKIDNTVSVKVSDTSIMADVQNKQEGVVDLTVSGGAPPYSFLWSDGSTQEDLIVLEVGTYSVVVTDSKGCTLTIEEIVADQVNPTTDISVESLLSIYPNPNNGHFNFSLKEANPTMGQIIIFNPEGKMVLNQPISLLANRSFPLMLESARPGLYYFQLITGESTFNRKVLIFP